MTIQNKIIINNTMSITNREDLKEKIHEIHNYMRNNGIGYGLNSLKTFNVLYGLKKIQDYNLFEKVGLTREECKFDYLLQLANDYSNRTIEVLRTIVIQELYDNRILKELLFYEIPYEVKDEVYNTLIKEINEISKIETSTNELLSGKIYEYFVGRDQTAISELGAYFTNRRIVDFILNNIQIKLNPDGSIPKMIDMFGGSGGFTTGYMNYLNKTFKDKINWETELNKIYHFDINKDVLKSAGLELFCLSNGIIPNMRDNIKQTNSFTYNFDFEEGFDLILTNPPYGGDRGIKNAKTLKRNLIKNYIQDELKSLSDKEKIEIRKAQLKEIEVEDKNDIKNNEKQSVNIYSCSDRLLKFAKKNHLTGNDKEACSLMLMMEILNKNGKAVGVLKEGIFFDKKYKNLREFLIKNYNVSEVISVPQNQFENTSTKTSIIIFDNTDEKTSQITFSELNIETYDNNKFIEIDDKIYLEWCKGDVKEVKKTFLTIATKETILNNDNCSLNHKDYNKISIECGDDFKLVKIKDVSNINLNKEKILRDKEYKYVEISDINDGNILDYILLNGDKLPTNAKNTINYYDILISSVRPKQSKLILITKTFNNINEYIFTSALIKLTPKEKYIYYIYAIISILSNTFENKLCNGSTYPRFKSSQLEELEIPIPKTPELIQFWENKISQPYNLKQEKERRLKEVEEEIKNEIIKIQENEDCEEVKLGDIIEYAKKKNKYQLKDALKNGKYKFYTSSQNNILYRNDYEFENKHILLGRGGNTSIHLASKFSVSHDDVYVININIYNITYIYYCLILNRHLICETFNGSTIKHTSKTKLEEIKIKLPKDKSLIENLQLLFDEVENLQKEIKELNEIYNECLKELSTSAIKNYDIFMKINDIDNENEDSQDKEEIEESKEDDNEEIKSLVSSNKSMTINELKEQCKTLGIKGYSKKKKEELIEMIKNHK